MWHGYLCHRGNICAGDAAFLNKIRYGEKEKTKEDFYS